MPISDPSTGANWRYDMRCFFMHYFKREIGNYYKRASRLNWTQHAALMLITDACYDRERFPTLDDAIEWTWAQSEDEINALKFVLSRFFVLDGDGHYVNDDILTDILSYHKRAETNKEIAKSREIKRKELLEKSKIEHNLANNERIAHEHNTNRAHDVNESSRIVHETPPNKESLITNKESLITNKESLIKNQEQEKNIVVVENSEKPNLSNETANKIQTDSERIKSEQQKVDELLEHLDKQLVENGFINKTAKPTAMAKLQLANNMREYGLSEDDYKRAVESMCADEWYQENKRVPSLNHLLKSPESVTACLNNFEKNMLAKRKRETNARRKQEQKEQQQQQKDNVDDNNAEKNLEAIRLLKEKLGA
jgi:uncharacterized protein YdaU (DUF1376 family)